jgi:hypothetical protein
MDTKSTACDLSPERLLRILNIGSDVHHAEDKVSQEQTKAELLQDRLAERLPVDPPATEQLPNNLCKMHNMIGVLAGESIGKLLSDANTDIVLIRNIKDYGKKLSKYAKSEVERRVAKTIYYVAIAAGLVFHGLKITDLSYKDLERSFSLLSKEKWLPEGLLDLLKKAFGHCKSKTK